jgi:pimeloyl-ACP methyl ester carboxylesterase
LSDITYQSVNYLSDDGLSLFARRYANAKATSSIIFMPGLTRNSADFEWLCEHLSAQFNLNIYAMDFRGRGKSEWDPKPENYNPLTYAKDLHALIVKEELHDVILAGTSLGGLVAMIFAAHFKLTPRALILNDIGPEINLAGLRRIQNYVGAHHQVNDWEQAVGLVKSINQIALPDLNDSEWMTMAQALMHETKNGQVEFSYDPAISQTSSAKEAQREQVPNLWQEFNALNTIPVLVIRGQHSDILSNQCVELMQRAHPSLEYAEVPNRGHAPLLNEPAAVESIKVFLHTHSQD